MFSKETVQAIASFFVVLLVLVGVAVARSSGQGMTSIVSKRVPSSASVVADSELRQVVGYCPRCCEDLGLCNSLGWQSCGAVGGVCTELNKVCNACDAADNVDLCVTFHADPFDVCTHKINPCNPLQPMWVCTQKVGSCPCDSTAGTVPCGQSISCNPGSAICP